MSELIKNSIQRTLAFHMAWGYAPTMIELARDLDIKDCDTSCFGTSSLETIKEPLSDLIAGGKVILKNNRLALASHKDLIEANKANELFFPRKLRNARRAAAYLKRLPWVRAVCLCNTTALGQASDGGDLDFFVITKSKSVWRTRFFSALPFKILNARPGERSIDPVCLSFFITDEALNLGSLALAEDDPYLRYWFLSLLPLYDDGILHELWDANRALLGRHYFATPWLALQSSAIPGLVPQNIYPKQQSPSFLEKVLRQMQTLNFPKAMADMANQDTRVVINDNVLKFHVIDNRKQYRDIYYKICHDLSIQP